MLRVGLTGGIATGKSRVLARLAEQGLRTVDLDVLAHAVIEPGRPAYDAIRAAFGPSIVGADGRIDRRALGAIVFSDAGARERLNAIVHPQIFEEEMRTVAAMAPAPEDVVVTDATLLVEGGYHLRFDRLIVTTCERRQQIARLMQRDGLSAGAAQARVESQMPGAEKARFGHHVIDTGGDPANTDEAAVSLAAELKQLARSWPEPAPVPGARASAALVQTASEGPRGLTPLRVLQAFADSGGAPLPALAAAQRPPHRGPWYEAGGAPEPAAGSERLVGAERLMLPVVLWSLAWHGPDADALVAAAVSVARLVHAEPPRLARAAAVALALWEVAQSGATPGDLAARVWARDTLVSRRAGAPVPRDVLISVDPGALRALAGGAAMGQVPPEVPGALARIDAAVRVWRSPGRA
jgi:dephospho-CoA kinase